MTLERITNTGDRDRVSFPARFLAPEQMLYGLAYNDNVEVESENLEKVDKERRNSMFVQPKGLIKPRFSIESRDGKPNTTEDTTFKINSATEEKENNNVKRGASAKSRATVQLHVVRVDRR